MRDSRSATPPIQKGAPGRSIWLAEHLKRRWSANQGGLLVVTWAHGDRLIDSGFRSDHAAEHTAWVDALNSMTNDSTTEGAER